MRNETAENIQNSLIICIKNQNLETLLDLSSIPFNFNDRSSDKISV